MVRIFTSYKGIQIKGLPNLDRSINKLLKVLYGRKQIILLKAAKKVAARIKEETPKGPTGLEKKSVYANSIPETIDNPVMAFAGYRSRIAKHAYNEEFGHGGPHPAPPHPTIRPVFDSMKEEIKNDISNDLGKTIEGAV